MMLLEHHRLTISGWKSKKLNIPVGKWGKPEIRSTYTPEMVAYNEWINYIYKR